MTSWNASKATSGQAGREAKQDEDRTGRESQTGVAFSRHIRETYQKLSAEAEVRLELRLLGRRGRRCSESWDLSMETRGKRQAR